MVERNPLQLEMRIARPGAWLMTASATTAFLAALIYYLWRGDGIAGTPGALLVLGSTALLALASAAMATALDRHWAVKEFLMVATFLDVVGTLFAAWLLEAHWIVGLMILAAIGWIVHIIFDAPPTWTRREPLPRPQEFAR